MSNQTSSEERPLPYGRIVVVKFKEGTKVRLKRGKLSSTTAEDMAGVQDVLDQFPGVTVNRLFTRSEKELDTDREVAEVAGTTLPDLNLFYRLDLPEGQDPAALVEALSKLPTVEIAYIEEDKYSVASQVPAEIEEGMMIPTLYPPGEIWCPPGPFLPPPYWPTPDFSGLQDYLNPAPTGIDALYTWTKTGGKGLNTQFADIEYGWNLSHEDLTSAAGTTVYGTNTGDDHGTQVLGEIIAGHNGFGVRGIVPESTVAVLCSISTHTVADCINHAASVLSPGDVILIELQYGYKPVEILEANYVAIQAAVAAGIVVVEAAGNGAYDLDAYNRPADMGGGGYIMRRSVRDSGAIIVGAGCPPSGTFGPDRSRWQYSNYGSRLDLQGQGREVCTTGDGDLFDRGPNRRYTDDFKNTSAASPQVVGTVLALQGISKARDGSVLTPAVVRQVLVDTGTPQQDGDYGPATQQIGPRPNLPAAIFHLWPPSIICPPAPLICPPAPFICPPAPQIQCPPAPMIQCPPAPEAFQCPPAPVIQCPPAPEVLQCPPAPVIQCPPGPGIFEPPPIPYRYGGPAPRFAQYPAVGTMTRAWRRAWANRSPYGFQWAQYPAAEPYRSQYLSRYGYPVYASGYSYGYQPGYGSYAYPTYETGYGYQPSYRSYAYPGYTAGYGYGYQSSYGRYGTGSQTRGGYGAQADNPHSSQQGLQRTAGAAPEGEFNPQMRKE